MLGRAEEVHAHACATSERTPIPDSESAKVRYDPSTGVAYHFTQSGRRLYHWPKFKTKSERACSCRKPDWMRIAPKGLSEGVLTFMCLRSGVVLGNTFLTGAEGCKDAGSALYSFHPLRVGIFALNSVICDTPCDIHFLFRFQSCAVFVILFDSFYCLRYARNVHEYPCFQGVRPREVDW
jgi:hypothetical protein